MAKRGARTNRTGRIEAADKFVALRAGLRQSAAWRSLSATARCVLIEMMAGVHETNNGTVPRSVRFLADVTGFSRGAVERALADLQERGFIVRTEGGHLGSDGRGKPSLWRVTEIGTATDRRPTKEYMDWRPPEKQKPVPVEGTQCPRRRDTSAKSVPVEGTGCPTRRDTSGDSGPQSVPVGGTNLIYQVGDEHAALKADPFIGAPRRFTATIGKEKRARVARS